MEAKIGNKSKQSFLFFFLGPTHFDSIGWIRLRKRENKNYRYVSFLLDRYRKFQKKIKKNTIMASFQTKIGWKMMRNRENKNFNSISFRHDA